MVYDIGIIGCGVAGTFAAFKISEKFKKKSVVVFEIGRPPKKRHRQIECFLGCFPNSSGQLYTNNLSSINSLINDDKSVNKQYNWVMKYLKEIDPMKIFKDKLPNQNILDIFAGQDLNVTPNDYYQWKPESVHKLSRLISSKFNESENITFNFDTIVENIEKEDDYFIIQTDKESCECKKIILCVGRSGWRWVTNLYKKFGIVKNDDKSTYGVRVEISSSALKGFNKSCCTLTKPNLEIGPFNWNGTIIPEDHSDLVISAFRNNEERWKTDKVSFSLLHSELKKDDGCAQTDRMGKLTFLLFNDRVTKEKIKTFVKNDSILNLLPEYKWLSSCIEEMEKFIPSIVAKGYMYIPHISPLAAEIKLNNNLESEVKGMYVAGESARIPGILGAAVSGALVANNVCND